MGAILEDHVAEIQSHCQLNLRGMRVQNVAMDERQAVLLIHGQERYVMFYAPIKRRPIQIDADGMVFGVLSHKIRGQRGRTAEIFTQQTQGTARMVLEGLGKKRKVKVRTLHAFFIQRYEDRPSQP